MSLSYKPKVGCGRHGTIHDHRRKVALGADGMPMLDYHKPGPQLATGSVWVWKCSTCGHEERWGANWWCVGVLECMTCGYEGVDEANCGCKPPPSDVPRLEDL